MCIQSERGGQGVKISDALLYTIHKNNNRITTAELLQYMKILKQYKMIQVNKDSVSVSLTDAGKERLEKIKLI